MLHQRRATSHLNFNQLPESSNTFLLSPPSTMCATRSSTAAASKKQPINKVNQKKLSLDESNPTDHGAEITGE
jgi:hypothetical protein